MINLVKTQTTPTVSSTFALAVGVAIIASQLQYPRPIEVYKVQQVGSTFSAFEESLRMMPQASETFSQSMASIYSSLAERQERLGAEFEAAIFDDIENLYEV